MHDRADKQDTPAWLNGRVFVQELSNCEFESCCSHPIKNPALRNSCKVTKEPSPANTFPIFTTWFDKREKNVGTRIPYCNMVTFPHFKS